MSPVREVGINDGVSKGIFWELCWSAYGLCVGSRYGALKPRMQETHHVMWYLSGSRQSAKATTVEDTLNLESVLNGAKSGVFVRSKTTSRNVPTRVSQKDNQPGENREFGARKICTLECRSPCCGRIATATWSGQASLTQIKWQCTQMRACSTALSNTYTTTCAC